MRDDHLAYRRERSEWGARCLSPVERRVLVLAARDGLSNSEIAKWLDIAPASIERILARAIVKLGRAVEQRQRRWWRLCRSDILSLPPGRRRRSP